MLWGTAGSALRIVVQIGAQIILARLLGPDQYGVFAMAVVVLSLGRHSFPISALRTA